jgi:hypothetical protein
MFRELLKIVVSVAIMAALAGCGGTHMTSFLNASAVPTNTYIAFRSGIRYSAPRGFCAMDGQTFQDEAKGFGVFVTCMGDYDRSRLLTVAHYPIDPESPPEKGMLMQTAGSGAKVLRIVDKDDVIYARLRGDMNDQELQPEFNRMITLQGGYVIMANLYARERVTNADFMARQVLARLMKGITTDPSKLPQFARYLPTAPILRPKLRP